MFVDVISMIASVGSWIVGSGTVSTRTSRLPCQVTAFMSIPFRENPRRGVQMGGTACRAEFAVARPGLDRFFVVPAW